MYKNRCLHTLCFNSFKEILKSWFLCIKIHGHIQFVIIHSLDFSFRDIFFDFILMQSFLISSDFHLNNHFSHFPHLGSQRTNSYSPKQKLNSKPNTNCCAYHLPNKQNLLNNYTVVKILTVKGFKTITNYNLN